MERCRRKADVSFRQVCRDSREAAQGAQPLVRSVATQTARTFGSPGRSLAERTIHGRRPCIEVRPSVPSGIFFCILLTVNFDSHFPCPSTAPSLHLLFPQRKKGQSILLPRAFHNHRSSHRYAIKEKHLPKVCSCLTIPSCSHLLALGDRQKLLCTECNNHHPRQRCKWYRKQYPLVGQS